MKCLWYEPRTTAVIKLAQNMEVGKLQTGGQITFYTFLRLWQIEKKGHPKLFKLHEFLSVHWFRFWFSTTRCCALKFIVVCGEVN